MSGIRIVKLFAWETPILDKAAQSRKFELGAIRKLLTIRAANQTIAMTLPLLSSVLVFAVYSLTGNAQDPAEIWTSLALLNLLRQPLMMLPNSLSSAADAHVALQALVPVFTADELPEQLYLLDADSKLALKVEDADFEWETSTPPAVDVAKGKGAKKDKKKDEEKVGEKAGQVEKVDSPSRLEGINLEVPKGHLTCIVGSVGCVLLSLALRWRHRRRRPQPGPLTLGPPAARASRRSSRAASARCAGLVGPSRSVRRRPHSSWRASERELTSHLLLLLPPGGSIGYCAQQAWIMNGTVRSNVLFGRDFDEHRYWEVIRAASLLADLDQLPAGDMTEIGEKGITLSGGCVPLYLSSLLERERLEADAAPETGNDSASRSHARCTTTPTSSSSTTRSRLCVAVPPLPLSSPLGADAVPLSQVDAHVGAAIFDNAIQGLLAGKTRILVTHGLQYLPQAASVVVMENGRIVEQGTYAELVASGSSFSRFAEEYGVAAVSTTEGDGDKLEGEAEDVVEKDPAVDSKQKGKGGAAGPPLMQKEEQLTGSVSLGTWKTYAKAANGWITLPFVFGGLILMGASQDESLFFVVPSSSPRRRAHRD